MLIRVGAVVARICIGAALFSLAMASGALAADDKTYVMKIALATVDDPLHEFAKNFAAAIEKDFERPHQGRDLPVEPIGFDAAAGRGRAIWRNPMPGCSAGISRGH